MSRRQFLLDVFIRVFCLRLPASGQMSARRGGGQYNSCCGIGIRGDTLLSDKSTTNSI